MKIYIVGTGGVGGYFGGLMAKGGLDVTFVARGENFRKIRQDGLSVKSTEGDFLIKPVQVIENINEIIKPDLIIISTKTYDTESVAGELAKVCHSDTSIITFQNGIDNDLKLKKMIPSAQIYPGIAYVISARTAPGEISQTGGMRKLVFGDRSAQISIYLQNVKKEMAMAGLNVDVSENILRDLWKKFIYIVPFSSLTALNKSSIGRVLADPVLSGKYEICVRECIVIADALKVNLPANIFNETMQITRNTAPESKSSLLVDIENGRKTEINTLIGKLLELAHKLKIAVPVSENIYRQLVREIGEK